MAFSLCRHPPFPFQQQKSELDNAFAATNGVLVNVVKCPSAGIRIPRLTTPVTNAMREKKKNAFFFSVMERRTLDARIEATGASTHIIYNI